VKGRLAEKNKDSKAAEEEYRAAIEASKGNANDWLNLALFYKHTNRLDEMDRTLNQAANAKATEEVLVECAEIMVRTGRNLSEAGALARRYIASKTLSEKSPLFKAHHVLGTVLEKQGNKEDAAREYREALTLASNFSPSRQALGRLEK
jgi:tetratricopeptide (TPR) repeat protein